MQPTQGFYGQQPQPPDGPPGHRARKSWPRRHRVLTVIGGIFGVFVLIGVIDAVAGGSHHSPGTLAAASSSAPASVAPSYPDVQSLIAAMAVHGAVCSNVSFDTGGAVSGALNPYADCSGISSGDTAIVIFKDHVSAVAYANNMLSTGEGLGDPTAEVVGPNWTVNTVPVFADKVVNAVGGQLIKTPSAAPSASAPAAPPASASAPVAPTMTRQTDTVVFRVSGSGYPSVQYGTDSNNDVPGGYGPLGNGVALPWSASLTYDSSALYYYVTAQLEGYGDISDSVTEVITTYCSDGSHKTESFRLAAGNASGGYAIAQAEYAGGDTGNATQAESDAGC